MRLGTFLHGGCVSGIELERIDNTHLGAYGVLAVVPSVIQGILSPFVFYKLCTLWRGLEHDTLLKLGYDGVKLQWFNY
jgi:hypothetical protein